MKTKERILLTSLELFNTEGEANITTVDIANELDISPGNLYYHYKGKEPIIKVLFDRFESQYVELLAAPGDFELDTEQAWFYTYVLFEETYKLKFFYENIHDILHRVPELSRRFEKLLTLQRATLELLLLTFLERNVLKIAKDDIGSLAQSISMTLTHWLSYKTLDGTKTKPELILHQGVFHIITLIAPHLAPAHRQIYLQARDILKRVSQE